MSKPAFILSPGRIPGVPRYTDRALRVTVSGASCDMHPARKAHRITADGVAQCAECYAASRRKGAR